MKEQQLITPLPSAALPLPNLFPVLTSMFPIDVGRVAVPAAQPGQEVSWSRRACRRLRQANHVWRAPHFDGGVVACGEQQLLVGRAEGHGVHHVVVLQARQTDVVMTVPDVAVLVLRTTGHEVSADVQEDEEALVVGREGSVCP